MYRVAGECRVDISTTKKTPTLGLHRIAKLLGNENKMNRSSGSSGLYNCGKIISDPFLSANSFARHTQMSSCYQLFETLKSNYKIKILSWSKSLSFYVPRNWQKHWITFVWGEAVRGYLSVAVKDILLAPPPFVFMVVHIWDSQNNICLHIFWVNSLDLDLIYHWLESGNQNRNEDMNQLIVICFRPERWWEEVDGRC